MEEELSYTQELKQDIMDSVQESLQGIKKEVAQDQDEEDSSMPYLWIGIFCAFLILCLVGVILLVLGMTK